MPTKTDLLSALRAISVAARQGIQRKKDALTVLSLIAVMADIYAPPLPETDERDQQTPPEPTLNDLSARRYP